MPKHSRLHYGWIIVGITICGMILIYGIRHSFSIFFPSILEEFGWSRGSTALMLSLNILIYGFTAPIAGSLADRWKPRLIMLIGIAILGLATAGCAIANTIWQFYLLFGIFMPIGTALCGWPVLSPTLSNWFTERRGLVMGLGQMGGGLSFTYGLVAELAISQLGWRHAYIALAILLVSIMLPIYLCLFNYRPEGKGLKAYGEGEYISEDALFRVTEVAQPHTGRWALSDALRTRHVWLLMLSLALSVGLGNYLVLAHQVKYAQDIGYSSTFTASIFAIFGIFMAVGQLFSAVSDWIGREKMITIAVAFSISAVAALMAVRDISQPWLLYVYAIFFGLGGGLYTPTIFAGAADLFSGRFFGTVSGMLLTGFGIGGVLGPWLGGYIYDVSGSYVSAFILAMGCFAFSCVTYWIAAPRNATKIRGEI